MHLKLKVFRFDPSKDRQPWYRTYEVEADPMDRLLDCLNRIRWEQDPTLSFRMSCGHGVCGSDAMKINGICGLACQKLVRDLGGEVLIEPLPVFRVIKDLVVDLDPFFEKYASVRPYLIVRTPPPEDSERRQSPEEHRLFEEALRCILCACCTAACPVNQSPETADYVGPAALVRAFRYLFDSRDEGTEERLRLLDQEKMVWGCRTHWKCTEVCPKEIPVTRQIGQIKRRVYETKRKSGERG
ncbi:MAG: succinate dehydrogenase iron-sulfur subunit [Desulfobacterota bacterium]|nr:succinate dehydrogenase iron-sulfur subunit [Thermodesulfobacteriota bacterium]